MSCSQPLSVPFGVRTLLHIITFPFLADKPWSSFDYMPFIFCMAVSLLYWSGSKILEIHLLLSSCSLKVVVPVKIQSSSLTWRSLIYPFVECFAWCMPRLLLTPSTKQTWHIFYCTTWRLMLVNLMTHCEYLCTGYWETVYSLDLICKVLWAKWECGACKDHFWASHYSWVQVCGWFGQRLVWVRRDGAQEEKLQKRIATPETGHRHTIELWSSPGDLPVSYFTSPQRIIQALAYGQ